MLTVPDVNDAAVHDFYRELDLSIPCNAICAKGLSSAEGQLKRLIPQISLRVKCHRIQEPPLFISLKEFQFLTLKFNGGRDGVLGKPYPKNSLGRYNI